MIYNQYNDRIIINVCTLMLYSHEFYNICLCIYILRFIWTSSIIFTTIECVLGKTYYYYKNVNILSFNYESDTKINVHDYMRSKFL